MPRRLRNYWAYSGPVLFSSTEAAHIFFGKSRDWLMKLDGKIDHNGAPWYPARDRKGRRCYNLNDIRIIALEMIKLKRLSGVEGALILDATDAIERVWNARRRDNG